MSGKQYFKNEINRNLAVLKENYKERYKSTYKWKLTRLYETLFESNPEFYAQGMEIFFLFWIFYYESDFKNSDFTEKIKGELVNIFDNFKLNEIKNPVDVKERNKDLEKLKIFVKQNQVSIVKLKEKLKEIDPEHWNEYVTKQNLQIKKTTFKKVKFVFFDILVNLIRPLLVLGYPEKYHYKNFILENPSQFKDSIKKNLEMIARKFKEKHGNNLILELLLNIVKDFYLNEEFIESLIKNQPEIKNLIQNLIIIFLELKNILVLTPHQKKQIKESSLFKREKGKQIEKGEAKKIRDFLFQNYAQQDRQKLRQIVQDLSKQTDLETNDIWKYFILRYYAKQQGLPFYKWIIPYLNLWLEKLRTKKM